ncbi:BTAD domain-containing putative transcriptional regulator [Streptomyces sp. WMMC905]|uniref:AfsR/SARP family transcriptional regulator n=1 Tax=Streptomyces sp. WMMC905 TaxID=3404123 RepID=UPI003B9373BB
MNEATPTGGSSADAEPTPLRVGALGRLEVRAGGEDRTPTAPMARRALAVLLLHANRSVSMSTLVDELWEADPPRLARKTVQTYVYQIRRALEPAGVAVGLARRLRTEPGGYRLVLRPGELDLWEFEHRVAQARVALSEGNPARGVGLLNAGLRLWRGEPFSGVAAGPSVTGRIAQLADTRLAALELRIEAELRLGRHHTLIGELRALTADHPLNERFAAQLMTAAHWSGRRGAALDAFARLRRGLAAELGVEPSQELQDLQRQVLTARAPRGSTSVDRWTVPEVDEAGPAVLPGSTAPPWFPPSDLVGRSAEIDTILGYLDGAGPRVVTLLGPVGVGKSALAEHVAHLLRDRFPDGLLYARLHDGVEPREPMGVLRALLHSAGVSEGLDARSRSEELLGVFREWASRRSVLLLLDDAAGTDQVLPLLPGGARSLALVTSRIRLPGIEGALTLSLEPLENAEAAALFARVSGVRAIGGESAALREVAELVGNLPLALRALAERFAARPMWTLPDLVAGLRDEGRLAAELLDDSRNALAAAIGAIARLSPPLRRALRLLASAPGPFDTAEACELLDRDTWSAQSVVGRLLDRHLVAALAPATDAAGPVTFRVHQLIRMAIAQEPSGARVVPLGGPVAAGRVAVAR